LKDRSQNFFRRHSHIKVSAIFSFSYPGRSSATPLPFMFADEMESSRVFFYGPLHDFPDDDCFLFSLVSSLFDLFPYPIFFFPSSSPDSGKRVHRCSPYLAVENKKAVLRGISFHPVLRSRRKKAVRRQKLSRRFGCGPSFLPDLAFNTDRSYLFFPPFSL